jgi:hypothetical protein
MAENLFKWAGVLTPEDYEAISIAVEFELQVRRKRNQILLTKRKVVIVALLEADAMGILPYGVARAIACKLKSPPPSAPF